MESLFNQDNKEITEELIGLALKYRFVIPRIEPKILSKYIKEN